MGAGIEIINDFGTVLINDTDPVLQLRNKYNVTATTGIPRYYDFTVSGVNFPIIAIRCAQYAFMQSYVRSGSNLTVRIGVNATVNTDLTIYHFDIPTAPNPTGHGVQIFDASGNCTFDSSAKTAVIYAVNPPTGIWSGTIGRIYAFAFHTSYNRYLTLPDSGSTYYFEKYINAAKVSGHTVDIDNNFLWSFGTEFGTDPGIDQTSGITGGFIIDVTSY